MTEKHTDQGQAPKPQSHMPASWDTGGTSEAGLQQAGLRPGAQEDSVHWQSCTWPCAPLGCPNRPHLCHLDHIGELGEAGDGDDVMVCPALGPGRRKPTLRGEAAEREMEEPLCTVSPEGIYPREREDRR